ncbi:hypothetical protein A3Q56_07536, partial [Intoshia linei]
MENRCVICEKKEKTRMAYGCKACSMCICFYTRHKSSNLKCKKDVPCQESIEINKINLMCKKCQIIIKLEKCKLKFNQKKRKTIEKDDIKNILLPKRSKSLCALLVDNYNVDSDDAITLIKLLIIRIKKKVWSIQFVQIIPFDIRKRMVDASSTSLLILHLARINLNIDILTLSKDQYITHATLKLTSWGTCLYNNIRRVKNMIQNFDQCTLDFVSIILLLCYDTIGIISKFIYDKLRMWRLHIYECLEYHFESISKNCRTPGIFMHFFKFYSEFTEDFKTLINDSIKALFGDQVNLNSDQVCKKIELHLQSNFGNHLVHSEKFMFCSEKKNLYLDIYPIHKFEENSEKLDEETISAYNWTQLPSRQHFTSWNNLHYSTPIKEE